MANLIEMAMRSLRWLRKNGSDRLLRKGYMHRRFINGDRHDFHFVGHNHTEAQN